VDENFQSYCDQGAFLSTVRKLSEDSIAGFISKLCSGHEPGALKIDDEEESGKPWELHGVSLTKSDFPEQIDIVFVNRLSLLERFSHGVTESPCKVGRACPA
jgi:hypothetical protein